MRHFKSGELSMARALNGKNLTQHITHELGVAIVAGEYSGDAAFPTENQLCEKFSASRSVLREAVKMLTAKGLLAARPRQGTWVQDEEHWNLLDPDVLHWLLERKFSLSLIRQFTETRRAFETQAAYFAAKKAKPTSLEKIEEALKRMEAAQNGDDNPLQSDIAFHVAILHASENPFYIQLEDLVSCALEYSIRLTNKFKGVPLASLEDHRAVYEAIRDGNAQDAADTMTNLIDEALDLIAKAEMSDGV